jgi:hypothetical protein
VRAALLRLGAAALAASGPCVGSAPRAAEPTWPTTVWPTATPAQVGMDAALVRQGVGFAAGYGGAGMVVRQGYVVSTWGDTNALVNVRSAAKSFGSILAGIAVGDGLVAWSDKAQDRLPSFGKPPPVERGHGLAAAGHPGAARDAHRGLREGGRLRRDELPARHGFPLHRRRVELAGRRPHRRVRPGPRHGAARAS